MGACAVWIVTRQVARGTKPKLRVVVDGRQSSKLRCEVTPLARWGEKVGERVWFSMGDLAPRELRVSDALLCNHSANFITEYICSITDVAPTLRPNT